jgi:DNA polymerase
MVSAVIEPTFAAWREKARQLLGAHVQPHEVDWCDATQTGSLMMEEPALPRHTGTTEMKVPAEFLKLARSVCAHSDERRFAILYRLLFRITLGGEQHLIDHPADADMTLCRGWTKAVGRDIHKMHAFVRFRLAGVNEETGREQFVAWYEPEYRIVRMASSFFEKRFAGMDWSILTPDECAHWDGHALSFTAGVSRLSVPDADAHDDLWRTYYRSIFNPARLKIQAMKSEMPMKFWKNLPESTVIQELISGSSQRVQGMLEVPERPVKPMPNNEYIKALHAKRLQGPGET